MMPQRDTVDLCVQAELYATAFWLTGIEGSDEDGIRACIFEYVGGKK